MQDPNFDNTTDRSLADIMAVEADAQPLWSAHELAAMLRHQLAAPLQLDLGLLGPGVAARVSTFSSGPEPMRTFGDLLYHRQPPLELLELVKEFAKNASHRAEAPLADEIATLLYILSIVVALRKHGRRITEWDDSALRHRLDWALTLSWLDAPSRDLIRESRQSLDTAISASASEETLATHRPPEMSAVGAVVLGQLGEYVLLEKLGEGGMGTVYKAQHTELDRIVAVKVLRPGQMADQQAVARFRREMKAAGRLDHPHIVRAHDARVIGDSHLLVMEYVDGLDLAVLVERIGPLPVADACEIVRQAATGLACAHQHGLVHRDIKPSNLMLTRLGQVKVLDLGLARIASAYSGEMTAVGQVMGTPDYMAPEQFSDSHAADIRADIYSLGCTLYKLLSGRAPFADAKHEGVLSKMRAHASESPPPIRSFRDDVPAGLATVLQKMLEKSPAQRFATPDEIVQALTPFTETADLKACFARTLGNTTPSPLPRMRFADTDRVGAPWRGSWATLVGLTALALIAIVSTTLWLRPGTDRPSEETVATLPTGAGVKPNVPAVVDGPLHGRIVLSWTEPGMNRPDLWLFSPDGKNRRNITDTRRAFEIHPKFSPDGRRIAFIRGGTIADPNGVWVCNSDGTGQRQVVAPRDRFERFASPVWLSNSRLCYTHDPKLDRLPDGEIWLVDLDSRETRLMFRCQEALGKGAGLVTDVSPDRRQLAMIAQTEGAWPTANVYVSDWDGKHILPVWVDRPDQWKDARALWSPDGKRLAWHHNFTAGADAKSFYCGVALAQFGRDERWTARFTPEQNGQVTPLAWSPRGDGLLCASPVEKESSTVAVFLMDDRFQRTQVLFEIEAGGWFSMPRDLGRLADWAAE